MEEGTKVKRRKVEEPTLMEEQTQCDVDKTTFEMHSEVLTTQKRNIIHPTNFMTFFDSKLQALMSQQTSVPFIRYTILSVKFCIE